MKYHEQNSEMELGKPKPCMERCDVLVSQAAVGRTLPLEGFQKIPSFYFIPRLPFLLEIPKQAAEAASQLSSLVIKPIAPYSHLGKRQRKER